MSPLLRIVTARTGLVLRGHTISQTSSIYTRPAKVKIGPVETVIGISMFSLAILGPSGWILAHLEDYKKKD